MSKHADAGCAVWTGTDSTVKKKQKQVSENPVLDDRLVSLAAAHGSMIQGREETGGG